MVRLETIVPCDYDHLNKKFTFQYGQIRNPQKLIMLKIKIRFTFQYGQIRNKDKYIIEVKNKNIYIPVWLDQKPLKPNLIAIGQSYLHSSMVRLETISKLQTVFEAVGFTFQYGQIRNNHLNQKKL